MVTFSLSEIDLIAAQVVEIVKKKNAAGIALFGNLGAGKTTLTQAIGRLLEVSGPIISPTFILMKRYEARNRYTSLVHVDAYRIEQPSEARALALGRYVTQGVFMVVEWPEKLGAELPEKLLPITLQYIDDDKRGIIGL